MVDKLGLGNETHELKLGGSFEPGSGVAFHSIRYDFKPASVDTTNMASLEIREGNSVTVNVPHVEGSGTTHTVYKGNKRPIQKECVLIIDHQTGEITLEKLANAIQLKKTRIEGSSKAAQGSRPLTPSEQIKNMKDLKNSPSKKLKKSQQTTPSAQSAQSQPQTVQAPRKEIPPPPPTQDTASPVEHMSDSSSGSGSASSDSEDERPHKTTPPKDMLSMPQMLGPGQVQSQGQGQSEGQGHGAPRSRFVSMLSEDLRLSESSSSDSD